ncbi:MAG: hypothetical protein GX587_16030, partial [Bacteroidales bacterium]|nr:hypothetical protein [Bacteroidales bacterium]
KVVQLRTIWNLNVRLWRAVLQYVNYNEIVTAAAGKENRASERQKRKDTIEMNLKCLLFKIIYLTSIIFLVIGCASYDTVKKPASQVDGLKEIIIVQDSITVHYSPYFDDDLCKKYLGIKPSSAKMIPSLLKIENNSSKILKVNLEKSSLNVSDEQCSSLELEDAFDRAKRSGAEVIAWQIGFGLIGASIAANNVTSANRSLEEDFHSKYFKPTLLNSGKTAQGVIFNQYPSGKAIRNCSFNLNISDLSSQKEINISILIPDSSLTIRRD